MRENSYEKQNMIPLWKVTNIYMCIYMYIFIHMYMCKNIYMYMCVCVSSCLLCGVLLSVFLRVVAVAVAGCCGCCVLWLMWWRSTAGSLQRFP